VLLFLYIRQASILLTLQFGACFILVSSSPNTLSTDMLFGGPNGANSPNLLKTNRLQLVIGPQLEPDNVSQSLFEKSSLDDKKSSSSIMKNCVKTVSSIVHNWNLIYTLFPQISGSIQWVS
jgi:hypothetical protein